MNNLFHRTADMVTNTKPGYSSRAFVAALSWFETIQDTYMDPVVVDGAHTFLEGLEWIRCYALPKSLEVASETSGDPGALTGNWNPKMFIPGDSAALQAMLEALSNEDLLFLVQDTDHSVDYLLQFGNRLVPAKFSSMKPVSGNVYEGRKGWEIELIAPNRYAYYNDPLLYITPGYWDNYVL